MNTTAHRRFARVLPWLGALLLLCIASAASAQAEADPPARVGFLSFMQGSVVFAPHGEDEWVELPQNRPLTLGDRVWTDRAARAEVQVGSATLHVDGETHLGISELDERAAQFIVQQGSVNARVRDLSQGENFEIDTPNLALRALQPGDYRVDVDASTGTTRVTVQSGTVSVFGEGGQSVNLGAGQQAAFAGRFLAQVQPPAFRQDDFALWASERNRLEDQSVAARYVPRGVVGYSQLDQHGQWSQDPNYGAVWYPQVPVADWAPYRYGHWSWIQPWGWTWVDDAPWGFAPFHYGRWTSIGNRWAWVPGRLAARPVYSPALVVFAGGLNVGSGPSVGWYPLAPGEAWYPVFRSSPRYLSFANFNINLGAYPRNFRNHFWAQRPNAITSVRQEDFRRGAPVYRHWQPVQPQGLGRAQFGVAPARPEGRGTREFNALPRLQAAPPATVAQPGTPHRFWAGRDASAPPAVREQFRAQQDQNRLQRDAERNAREQQRQAESGRQQQDQRLQREQVLRQQQEQAGRIQAERSQRETWQQRQQQERGQREAAQQRQQQDQAQREAWQQQRQQQEQAQREAWQQQRQQQERGQREAFQQRQQQEQRSQRVEQQRSVAPQQVQPVVQPEHVLRQRPQPQQQAQQVQPAPPAPRSVAEPRGEGGWQRGGGGDGEGRGRSHWQR